MKTNELQGAALDWAVAQCEYSPVRYGFDDNCPEYSTDWAQGGPIIERERIRLDPRGLWCAAHDTHEWTESTGPTPLVAAMRCYVATKLGDEIELPEELMGERS
jgi:hypothetical protein